MTPRHIRPRGANQQPELSKTKDIQAYININKQQYSKFYIIFTMHFLQFTNYTPTKCTIFTLYSLFFNLNLQNLHILHIYNIEYNYSSDICPLFHRIYLLNWPSIYTKPKPKTEKLTNGGRHNKKPHCFILTFYNENWRTF